MGVDSNPTSQPLYFNCNMCGECCSSWNIPIETEKAERLLEKPWVQARLAETNRTITPMSEETYRIPLTDENVCVFLAEDRRCMVETREGLSLKPHECQRFPFATVRMPNGQDWHETSAACKSISEKLLLAFQPILPKPAPKPSISLTEEAAGLATGLESIGPWEDSLGIDAALEPVAQFPKRIAVNGFRNFSEAQYQFYQEQLKAIFTQPEILPEVALWQANQLLRQIASRKAPDKITIDSLLSEKARWHPAMAKLLTLGFLRKPYRTLSWVNLLLGQDYPDPRIFSVPIQLSQQRRVPWDAKLNHRLNAFLFNLLQRKRIIALGSSLSAHLAMAGVACLLVQWYAKTLAWLQESPDISEKDVSTAIRLVERYYTGHQPRFLAYFTNHWRGEWIAALLFGL